MLFYWKRKTQRRISNSNGHWQIRIETSRPHGKTALEKPRFKHLLKKTRYRVRHQQIAMFKVANKSCGWFWSKTARSRRLRKANSHLVHSAAVYQAVERPPRCLRWYYRGCVATPMWDRDIIFNYLTSQMSVNVRARQKYTIYEGAVAQVLDL